MGFLENLFEYHWNRIALLRQGSPDLTAHTLLKSDPVIVALMQSDRSLSLQEALLIAITCSSRPLSYYNNAIQDARSTHSVRLLFPFLYRAGSLVLRDDISDEQQKQQVATLIREIVRRANPNQLAHELQEPLFYLSTREGIHSEAASLMLNELGVTFDALEPTLTYHAVNEALRRLSHSTTYDPRNRQDILAKELKEAGVVIPSAGAARRTTVVEDIRSPEAALPRKKSTKPPVIKKGEKKRKTIPTPVEALSEEPASTAPTEMVPQAEPLPSSVGSPLSTETEHAFLDSSERARILSEVFHGDVGDYSLSIALLEDAPNWTKASAYVQTLLIRREIDPTSPAAQALSEAVYRKFHRK